jgi:uncharacterized protein (DUF2147 family)
MTPLAISLLDKVRSAADLRTRATARSCRSGDTAGGPGLHAEPPSDKAPGQAFIAPTRSCGAATMIALALFAAPASATETAGPVGTWATPNGQGVIEIGRCGSALCGWIVGIERGPAEAIPTDAHGRSQCGLAILSDEKPATDGSWLGVVTDPRDGGTYQAKLWLDARGDLKLRGFIGIPQLGSTQTWHRFTGHLTAGCRLL